MEDSLQSEVAALLEECAGTADRMPALLARYQADYGSLDRRYAAPGSLRRRERFRAFFAQWQEVLDALPFGALTRSDRADRLLFRNLLKAERKRLEREERQFREMEPLLPLSLRQLSEASEGHWLREEAAEAWASRLHRAAEDMQQQRGALAKQRAEGPAEGALRPSVACRAAAFLNRLREALAAWFGFYDGYDPAFTWWAEQPYRALDAALAAYADFLRKEIAGAEDADAIIGDPIGRDALLEALEAALIDDTPEELIAVAEREREWCLAELRKAAQEMGCGDDWKAAIERVKEAHVAPGQQPALVRELAEEAIRFVTERDLVTVPPLAAEAWRMEMMPPEKQKVAPFFLGGEVIQVSFPTNAMAHPQRRMSLRGNNRHFARATVQHELIPGHHLQMFRQERHRPYRRLFATPFWTEGWTLHWEMLLWDMGFAQSPEDRVGMLFWRLHRCVRVVFSLRFHMERLTAMECVEMLVGEVGHERDNALAEVRRSFGGDYDPLYQCAYLLGGLQAHALHRELVGAGKMSHRAFHDAFLRENCMPIAVLRALLTDAPIEADFRGCWRFSEPGD